MTRPNPAVAALQRDAAQPISTDELIANADPDTAAGLAAIEAQHAADEADRAFGAAIREAITEAHDADTAQVVMVAFTRPNRVHSMLVARLDKIVQAVRS